MSDWMPIKTAPRDGTHVLLFGRPSDQEGLRFKAKTRVTGYWDNIDEAWCATTSTWEGPFIDATEWQPLPPPPTGER